MIEGYIIEGKRYLRGDPEPDFFTSDKVFTRLSDAVEESRKIYEELLGFIKEDDESYYDDGEDQLKDDDESYYDDWEDPLEENFFTDDLSDRNAGYFSIRDTDEYFAEGFIKKVPIDLGDKKLEETNNGYREESTE